MLIAITCGQLQQWTRQQMATVTGALRSTVTGVTYWSRDKTADVRQTTTTNKFPLYFDSNVSDVCSRGSDCQMSLVQVMAWCRNGAKPLPEPMMTQFGDVYMRHQASMWHNTRHSDTPNQCLRSRTSQISMWYGYDNSVAFLAYIIAIRRVQCKMASAVTTIAFLSAVRVSVKRKTVT